MAWPVFALFAWGLGWGAYALARALSLTEVLAFLLGAGLGALLAVPASTPWRRVFVVAGFPLSFAATGAAAAVPAWAWLVPLGLLLLFYPLRAWRDAPIFPTPAGALRGLGAAAPLGEGAKVLDAGCGLGAGLAELRREYPQARLFGIEWSPALCLLCAWLRRDATVRRGDIWKAPWSEHDLIYLFQRPESLTRAMMKAAAEMKSGAWLASLEFQASGWRPDRVLQGPDGRPVWLYQRPFRRRRSIVDGDAQMPAERP